MDNYNYPLGADNSEAPWNEAPDTDIEREVSISLSFVASTFIHEDADEEEIKEAIEGDVIHYIKEKLTDFKDLNVDEIEVLD